MAEIQLFLHQSPSIRKKIKANPKLLNDPNLRLPIHISYPVKPGRFRMSTGIVVAPIQWDTKTQKVNQKHSNYAGLNRHLAFLVSKIGKAYWKMIHNHEIPTPKI